jgi:hypothetical protein
MPAVNDQPCPVGPSETFKTSRLSPKSTNATDLAVFAHAPRHFCAPFGRATSKPPRQTTPRSVPTIPIAESPEQAVQSNPVYKRSLPNHPRQLASCHATSYKPPDSGSDFDGCDSAISPHELREICQECCLLRNHLQRNRGLNWKAVPVDTRNAWCRNDTIFRPR